MKCKAVEGGMEQDGMEQGGMEKGGMEKSGMKRGWGGKVQDGRGWKKAELLKI